MANQSLARAINYFTVSVSVISRPGRHSPETMGRGVVPLLVQRISISFLTGSSNLPFFLESTDYVIMVTPLEGQAACRIVTRPLFCGCVFGVWK